MRGAMIGAVPDAGDAVCTAADVGCGGFGDAANARRSCRERRECLGRFRGKAFVHTKESGRSPVVIALFHMEQFRLLPAVLAAGRSERARPVYSRRKKHELTMQIEV